MEILEKILLLVFCHLIGDYVLQIDFIAKTKGINFYHLLVHCLLYIVPFSIVFGMGWQLWIVFAIHIAADTLKARYRKIKYSTDQILHYVVLLVYLI